MKLKTIIGFLALVSMAYCAYISIDVNPDITFGTWLGYKYGINWSENIPFKLIMVALVSTYAFMATSASGDNADPK